jgi:hypothetical protein
MYRIFFPVSRARTEKMLAFLNETGILAAVFQSTEEKMSGLNG